MPGLNASSVTLADYPTGLNLVTFDIDPSTYNPFTVGIRGNSMKVLDGTVLHQFLGLQKSDFVIQMAGVLTEYDTLKALWTKYRQGGGGQQFILTDWYPNSMVVTFSPGIESFLPTYIPGACMAHNFTMTFNVIQILEFVGGAY